MPQRMVTVWDPLGTRGATHVNERVSQQYWGYRNSTWTAGSHGAPSIWHSIKTMGIVPVGDGWTVPLALKVMMSTLPVLEGTSMVIEVSGRAWNVPAGLEY